mmetsp:Transcript_8394/g.14035  ORF Transcript_8394/g.14035 Transcript_8394/m.14035 type:complete len:109 (+) Transcript_8394:97-423(+)
MICKYTLGHISNSELTHSLFGITGFNGRMIESHFVALSNSQLFLRTYEKMAPIYGAGTLFCFYQLSRMNSISKQGRVMAIFGSLLFSSQFIKAKTLRRQYLRKIEKLT